MPAKKMSDDDLVAAIHQFLDTSPARDLRQQTAAAAIGVSQSLIAKVSSGRWESWRYEALAKRVAGATLDARADGRFPSLQEVSRRSGLTMSQVQHGFADVIASASGIDPSTPPARRRADELQARFEQIVDTAITNAKYKEDLVWARLREQANYRPLRARREELQARVRRAKASLPSRMLDAVDSSGTVRISDSRNGVISRAALRPDVGAIGWPLITATRNRSEDESSATLSLHQALRAAGELLGTSSPDVENLTLTSVQESWATFRGSESRRRQGRRGALLLIEVMLSRAFESEEEDATELASIDEWLRATSASRPDRRDDALSAEQSELLVTGCLAVITSGRQRMAAISDVLDHSFQSTASDNVAAVADWGLALLIIVARFTGLRARSLVTLRPTDLYEIGPDAFALLWRHEKKTEEHVAVVPASVAFLMKDYAHSLALLRSQVNTEYLFLGRGRSDAWVPLAAGQNNRLPLFLERHIPAPLCQNRVRRPPYCE